MRRFLVRVVVGVLIPAVSVVGSAGRGAGPQAAWKPETTQKYLDTRAAWWIGWAAAARGQGTSCVSCHTAVPYALARPALSKLPDAVVTPDTLSRLLAGVRTRVEKWNEVTSVESGGKDPLAPFYGGTRRDPALDTESVLNALILVVNDPSTGGKLDDATSKALDHMWARQRADGAWRWLDFGLRPWEKDGEYYGAALAAVAAGSAGDKYPRHQDAGVKPKAAALRKYLKTQLEKQPFLHNRALGLWAESHLKGVFTEGEKKQLVADLFAVQRPDGGWNLGDLGKTKTDHDAPGWEVRKIDPAGSASDGYATGLVVLALRRTGVAAGDERLKKGMAWLSTNQAADGTWPTAYLNAERNPGDDIGKFMRDAGAAFATLALTESN